MPSNQQRQHDTRTYAAFLRRKIEIARRSMRSGHGIANDDVEAEFAARRALAEAPPLMGGSAIPCAGRFSTAELPSIAIDAAILLGPALQGLPRHIVRSYTEKPDHGDLDMLYARERPLKADDLQDCAGISLISVNGPVLSFGLPFDKRTIQVDLIWSAPDTFAFARRYFDYNDLGNLLGRVFHRAGFKFGHRGLLYPLRNGTQMIEEVLVTDNFDSAISFMDFPPYPARGFANLEAIFRYATSSPFFSPSLVALERRSHRARVRDRKRPTYRAFAAWCERTPGLPDYSWETDPVDWLSKARHAFPAFAARLDAARQRLAEQHAFKTRFNGNRLRAVTGLEGRALGALMQRMRKNYPLDGLSADGIESLALRLAREQSEVLADKG